MFGTPDKTLALVFDMLHETMFQAIWASHPFKVGGQDGFVLGDAEKTLNFRPL